MTLQELYQGIGLLPEDIARLEEAEKEIPIEEVTGYIERLTRPETAAEAYDSLKEYLGEEKEQFGMLYCQLEAARRLHRRYAKMRIPDKIFFDTMKCFPRFMAECRVRNGKRYFDRGWWTFRQVSMRIFRIGALEYELKQTTGENSGESAAGRAVGLHIPSDADFSPESVERSLEEAKQFLAERYPDFCGADYVCDSWLLSPALKELLPEDSHILAFQRRFEIRGVDLEDRGYMRWLFAARDDAAIETLPEDTRLRRAAKTYLAAGGRIGAARGTLKDPRA